MNIMISGSMSFAKEMIAAKKQLEKSGNKVELPFETVLHLKKPALVDNLVENLQYCITHDIIRKSFDLIAAADAIVVLNYPRNGINGYIGTSTIMEIGIAYFLKRKIFVLYNIPHFDKVRWAYEIAIMQPVILHGDLKKVKA
ncbi:MAG TPA: hypothetical protein VGT05_03515 [Patescibacteria group bacterium]|nr:hypothetical protein [Patescibacteria group bacterium]